MNYGFNDAKEKIEMFSKTEAYNDLGFTSIPAQSTNGVVKRFASDAIRLVNHKVRLNSTIMSEIGVTTLAVGQSVVIGVDTPPDISEAVKGFTNGYFQTLSHLERSISDDVNISLKAEFIGLNPNPPYNAIVYRIQNDGYQPITFSETNMTIDVTILCQNAVFS